MQLYDVLLKKAFRRNTFMITRKEFYGEFRWLGKDITKTILDDLKELGYIELDGSKSHKIYNKKDKRYI
jgi:hypothetical protein